MPVFLVDDHPDMSRVDAETWVEAEAKLDGKGRVIGELVEEREVKAAAPLTEIKFAQDEGTMRFSGYGAVFNNVDLGGDKILPGAFSDTLAQHKAAGTMPSMLLEHGARAGGPVLPAGVWSSMIEDGHGLKVEGQLADTQHGREAYILMKMGALKGLSIGYRPTELGRPGMQDGAKRLIKAAKLGEVSIVATPMNTMAGVTALKSGDELKAEITKLSDLGDLLREAAGWSRSQAEAVLSNFQTKADQGEPDEAEIVAALRRNLSILQE